ncbi:MAG: hypothetical protein ACR2QZ_07145 [Woeseiaceae bacterium]
MIFETAVTVEAAINVDATNPTLSKADKFAESASDLVELRLQA